MLIGHNTRYWTTQLTKRCEGWNKDRELEVHHCIAYTFASLLCEVMEQRYSVLVCMHHDVPAPCSLALRLQACHVLVFFATQDSTHRDEARDMGTPGGLAPCDTLTHTSINGNEEYFPNSNCAKYEAAVYCAKYGADVDCAKYSTAFYCVKYDA